MVAVILQIGSKHKIFLMYPKTRIFPCIHMEKSAILTLSRKNAIFCTSCFWSTTVTPMATAALPVRLLRKFAGLLRTPLSSTYSKIAVAFENCGSTEPALLWRTVVLTWIWQSGYLLWHSASNNLKMTIFPPYSPTVQWHPFGQSLMTLWCEAGQFCIIIRYSSLAEEESWNC